MRQWRARPSGIGQQDVIHGPIERNGHLMTGRGRGRFRGRGVDAEDVRDNTAAGHFDRVGILKRHRPKITVGRDLVRGGAEEVRHGYLLAPDTQRGGRGDGIGFQRRGVFAGDQADVNVVAFDGDGIRRVLGVEDFLVLVDRADGVDVAIVRHLPAGLSLDAEFGIGLDSTLGAVEHRLGLGFIGELEIQVLVHGGLRLGREGDKFSVGEALGVVGKFFDAAI